MSTISFLIDFDYPELSYLAMEAAQNDGRLARYPLKNKSREIEAHCFLLSLIAQLIEEHDATIEVNVYTYLPH